MKKTIMTFILPFLLFGILMEMSCTKGVAIQSVCNYYDVELLKAQAEKTQEKGIKLQKGTLEDTMSVKSGLLLLRKKEKNISSKKKKGTSSKKVKNIDDLTMQGTQALEFFELSAEDVVKNIGALFTADQKKTGILASVSMAQFILESGYGKSELAQNANNLFGMKCSLSGNDWAGSTWDDTNKYIKKTQEQNADGSYEIITADFRKYLCIEDSIADHSAYLLGAKNGNELRYDGLKGCTNYKKAIQIIKDGGYATDFSYVQKLCSIIERWDLTQFDIKQDSMPTKSKKNKNTRKKVKKSKKVKKLMQN